MQKIIFQIRKELEGQVEPEYKKSFTKYSGGEIKNYGVRTPYVRKITRHYLAQIKVKNKKEIFVLCEELLKSDISEEATIAFQWALGLNGQYQKDDFKVFEKWLKLHVNNWAKCDDFCAHAFGKLLLQFPEFLPRIKKEWTHSSNLWLRRASTVILIPLIKADKKFLADVFETAEILLEDKEDLVQKGYGWMLKETANKYQKQVFNFVMKRKNRMPRVALRYAIEKMPQAMRKQAMAE